MEKENIFKWKHYQADMILWTVRWYLRYNLSFRDLVEMMEERGLSFCPIPPLCVGFTNMNTN
jgi:IS6 family transposase